MKNVILHVGPGKTGSSAIQNWLVKHRAKLAEHGVFYPKHDLDVNGVSAGHALSLYEYDVNHKLQLSQAKLTKVLRQFEESGCETLLLSSEAFAMGIDAITDQFPNSKVIYYFRSPIESAESVYNQSIKRHFNTDEFKIKRINLKRLEVFLDVIKTKPNIQLDLKMYGREFFINGDIVTDLMASVDASIEVPTQSKVVNTSYSFEALEFKRALNEIKDKGLHGRLDRFLQGYDGATRSYTFINEQTKSTVIKKLSAQIETLIAPLGQSIQPMLNVLTASRNKNFVDQNLDNERLSKEFEQMLQIIKQSNPLLFVELFALLRNIKPEQSNLKLLKNVIEQTKLSLFYKIAVYPMLLKWKFKLKKGRNES